MESELRTSTSFPIVGAMKCPILPAFILSIASCISAQPQVAGPVLTQVAEAQLDSLAMRVGEKIAAHNRDEGPVSVLVFDFTWRSPENSSRLGSILADRFAQLLQARTKGVDVMKRRVLTDYMKNTGTNIEDLHIYPTSFELAEKLGATAMIRGNLLEGEKRELRILLQIQALGRGFFHNDETEFAISRDMEDRLFQPAPSNSKPPDLIPPEPGVLVMGPNVMAGVTWPACISCPIPNFSVLSLEAKIRGTIELSVVVTTTGEVTAIYVEKGLPLGMTQDLIGTVKKWKFRPATQDGKPVSVRIPIQSTTE